MTENKSRSGARFDINVVKRIEAALEGRVEHRGVYTLRVWKNYADSVNPLAEPIEEVVMSNLTTAEGLTHILNCYLASGSFFNPLFVGLINNTSYTAIAQGDNAAAINGANGWIELTGYSGSYRQAMGALTEAPSLPSSASAIVASTSGTPPTFIASGTISIKGAFLIAGPVHPGSTTSGAYGDCQGPNGSPVALISETVSGSPTAASVGNAVTVSLAFTETTA